jgi:hypothetical protein
MAEQHRVMVIPERLTQVVEQERAAPAAFRSQEDLEAPVLLLLSTLAHKNSQAVL